MKRAVHLVRRDMQKTKLPAILCSQFPHIGPGGLEQAEGPIDIGADERLGAGKRTVYVALSGEMQDRARLITVEQTLDKGLVADVPLLEMVARMLLHRGEVLQIARIRELVEVDHGRAHQREPIQNEVRANKPGSAGDE